MKANRLGVEVKPRYGLMIEVNNEAFLAEVRALYPNGHPDFYKKMVELCDLHNRKNGDYASNEDPMSNFTRVGNLCNEYDIWNWEASAAYKVATIYMLKQFDAFMNLLKCKKEGQVEGVSDRLGDVTVYSVIMDILYREANSEGMQMLHALDQGALEIQCPEVANLPGVSQNELRTYIKIKKMVKAQLS